MDDPRSSGGENSMDMEMDMEYMDTQNYASTNDYAIATRSPSFANHNHHQQQPAPLPPSQQQQYYNDHPLPNVPARTESGESQRSQTRRFAAGHAEMQRSAFLSSQNEQDAQLQQVKKIKAEVAAMDSSETFQDCQPQKKPRRYTKDPKDEEDNGT